MMEATRNHQNLFLAASIVLGVGSSFLTTFVMNVLRDDSISSLPKPVVEKQKTFVVRAAPADHLVEDSRLDEVEDRIEMLEREAKVKVLGHLNRAEVVDADEKPSDQANTVIPTIEEETAMLIERFAGFDRTFEAEESDHSWSPQATRSLEAGLGAQSEQIGFSLVNAACKSTFCRATVEFSNYASALAKAVTLPQLNFDGLNCSQHIWAEPPNDESAPYRTEFYLDCSALRRG